MADDKPDTTTGPFVLGVVLTLLAGGGYHLWSKASLEAEIDKIRDEMHRRDRASVSESVGITVYATRDAAYATAGYEPGIWYLKGDRAYRVQTITGTAAPKD